MKIVAGSSLHIGCLNLITDRPMAPAQASGMHLVRALDTALAEAGARRPVRIGELVVRAPSAHLSDKQVVSRLAAAVARRILERAPD